MFFCRTKRHVWKSPNDADKCCNGYKRIMVCGSDIPPGTPDVQINSRSGVKFCRIWVRDEMNADFGLRNAE